jgi:hypothetical protein
MILGFCHNSGCIHSLLFLTAFFAASIRSELIVEAKRSVYNIWKTNFPIMSSFQTSL